MNIIIYTLVILTILYFLLKFITNISSKKISKSLRFVIILGLIVLAILFAIGGRFLLSLPLTLASLALLKLKGLSIFQLISLFRLIQTLRRSGRFSFNNTQNKNFSNLSVSESCKILNLDEKKKLNKQDINKAYLKIQKKIHPDVSPETSRLSSIVNEARDVLMEEIK
ncbi:J domain-containing protein [Pelagibacterales bacterium SAG-MED39]|nr:J domain-containing protein [Pelagibacterales bacterium SAG-MED39]